jgi:hypothetical protein
MKADIALAIIGALIGVTVAQFKGDILTDHLSRFFRERWQKVSRTLRQSDEASE